MVFCDLRGFTAFSARAEPDTDHGGAAALLRRARTGRDAYEATLTSFSGDGAMVLLNAPVSCSRSGAARRRAWRATCRRTCRSSSPAGARWTRRLGFGIGLAMGPATVGADRLRRPARLHRHRQRGEPRLAPVRQRGGQPDPGRPRRRPGDRRAGSSRAARGAATSRDSTSPFPCSPSAHRWCRRSGRMSCFESAAYRVRAFEVRTRLALESKATSGTFSPFSSYRMARLLAPILGIIASSRVCAL